MKRLAILFLSLALISTASYAQDDKSKRKSPPATAEASMGGATVTIDYSSPRANDRAIYGELVPFGKIWRAGANEATTITISQDMMVAGQKLKAGTYALFVIPEESGKWTVIFNTEAKQWGAYKHDQSKDALRIEASTSDIDHVENLTYSISDGMVHLDWADTRMSFSIKP